MTTIDDVRAFNDAFAQALADQDVERLVAMYTDDGRLMVAGQPMIQGRDALERTLRAWVEDGPVMMRFESDEVIESGNLVVDIGHINGPHGHTKYVVVHQRQPDGRLRIAIDAPSWDGPGADGPVADLPVADGPAADVRRTVADGPVADLPVVDGPAADVRRTATYPDAPADS